MNLICKYLSGSHSYGLNNQDSDLDYLGVGLNTKIEEIVGLEKNEYLVTKINGEDTTIFELRRFLTLLKKGSTHALEILFNEGSPSVSHEIWNEIRENKNQFLDTAQILNSLKGYIHGEKHVCFGYKTAELGSKRKVLIDKHGYSPKNAVQLLRLCFCGEYFIERQAFPVNISLYNKEYQVFLKNIKETPADYTTEDIKAFIEVAERSFLNRLDNRDKTKDLSFNLNFAAEICYRSYFKNL